MLGLDLACWPAGYSLSTGGLDLSGHFIAQFTPGPTEVGLCKEFLFSVRYGPIWQSAGGLDWSGTSAWSEGHTPASAGGLDWSGSAAWSEGHTPASAGGLDWSGSAAWSEAHKWATSGGLDWSGSDTLHWTAGTFSPATVPGLLLWLDGGKAVYKDAGATPCAVGDQVQQWNDQSGHGWNASQPTAANRPTYQLWSGGPSHALNFNGTAQYLLCNGLTSTAGAYSLFVVVNNGNNAGNFQALLDSQNGRLAFCSPISGGTGPGWYDTAFRGGGSMAYVAQRLTFIFPGGSAAGVVRRGGANVVNPTAVGTPPLAMTTTIGSAYTANAGWLYGELAEVLLYAGVVSSPNMTQIETYLAGKWGVP